MKYILASKSPRRKEILEQLGIEFEIVTAETDESSDITDPAALVEELALRKGEAVFRKLTEEGRDLGDTVILSSDTVVAVDGEILGKPHNAENASRMLHLLQGRTHEVFSGIALIGKDKRGVSHDVTKVTFSPMDDAVIAHYIEREQPFDKAGAYAIQGIASGWIPEIRGEYFTVVGLPVCRLNRLHRELFGTYFL